MVPFELKSGTLGFVMLCPADSTLFNVGEVWQWSDDDLRNDLYLLLSRELEKEYMMTIKTKNQQCWRALNLMSGAVTQLKLHTSVFSNGAAWVRRS